MSFINWSTKIVNAVNIEGVQRDISITCFRFMIRDDFDLDFWGGPFRLPSSIFATRRIILGGDLLANQMSRYFSRTFWNHSFNVVIYTIVAGPLFLIRHRKPLSGTAQWPSRRPSCCTVYCTESLRAQFHLRVRCRLTVKCATLNRTLAVERPRLPQPPPTAETRLACDRQTVFNLNGWVISWGPSAVLAFL